jgi:predicted PolB exonuclease-like 3'-5' exonuclease
MLHRIAAPGLSCRPYFHRFTDDAVDLCDVLSSFGRAKATLHEISRMLGFAGKASGVDGGQVEQLVAEGRIADVAAYCQEDVVNTYRIWLLHELFCGRLSEQEYEASEEVMWRRGLTDGPRSAS